MLFDRKPIFVGGKKKRKKNTRRGGKKKSVLWVNSQNRSSGESHAPWFVWAMVAILILAGAVWGLRALSFSVGRALFAQNNRFEISRFDVRTSGILKLPQVLDYGGLQQGMNMFSFKLPDLQSKLEEAYIVKQAVVRRQLPNTLSIVLTEREAVARLGPPDSPIQKVVDMDGVVIRKSFQAQHLPLILGVNQSEYPLGTVLDFQRTEAALNVIRLCNLKKFSSILHVGAIAVGSPEFVMVRLKTGERLKLPRQGLETKIRKAAIILQKAVEQGERIEHLDLTTSGDPFLVYRS